MIIKAVRSTFIPLHFIVRMVLSLFFCRFGEKYTLTITADDEHRREDLISSIKEIFPSSVKKGTHSTCLLWDITKSRNDRLVVL